MTFYARFNYCYFEYTDVFCQFVISLLSKIFKIEMLFLNIAIVSIFIMILYILLLIVDLQELVCIQNSKRLHGQCIRPILFVVSPRFVLHP